MGCGTPPQWVAVAPAICCGTLSQSVAVPTVVACGSDISYRLLQLAFRLMER
jgi:hypothetical protein